MPKENTGRLQRAYSLLATSQWKAAVEELDILLSGNHLPNRMLVGAALAMKAEAIDKLGDPAGAAAILSEAVEVDLAASKQFA